MPSFVDNINSELIWLATMPGNRQKLRFKDPNVSFYCFSMKNSIVWDWRIWVTKHKPFSCVYNRHFRDSNPTGMVVENVRHKLDLHVLKCDRGSSRSRKLQNDHQLSPQLLILNCNFYQILSLSNAAIEAMVCLNEVQHYHLHLNLYLV